MIEGSPEFKAAVGRLYEKGVDSALVLQENGATGASRDALVALVDPGDHVVREWPTYQPLWETSRMMGVPVAYLSRPARGARRRDLLP
ncbi:hypothetical protein AAK967_03030 [Atopobiaceae bacterium 24-176]